MTSTTSSFMDSSSTTFGLVDITLNASKVLMTEMNETVSEEVRLGLAYFKEKEAETEQEHLTGLILVIYASALFLCMSAKTYIRAYKIAWLPESFAYIVIGAIFGGIILISKGPEILKDHAAFSVSTFNLFLLPGIIFDGAFSMKQLYFWRQMKRILMLAIFGTLISTATMALAFLFFDSFELIPHLTPANIWAFAGLLSAVDPVSVLSTFSALGVNQTLFALVTGEAMLNDAVAIVIFRVAIATAADEAKAQLLANDTNYDVPSIATVAVVEFLKSTLGSIALGIALTLFLTMWLNKFHKIGQHHVEPVIVVVLCAYATFISAELLTLSGIVTTVVFSLGIRHYAVYNLTETTRDIVYHASHQVAELTESAVYVQIGIGLVVIRTFHFPLFFIIIAFGMIGRALNVFPIAAITHAINKNSDILKPITWRSATVIWHSGLRGGIAYALVINMPIADEEIRAQLHAVTLVYIVFTVLVNGGTTSFLLSALNIHMKSDKSDKTNDDSVEVDVCDACERQKHHYQLTQREMETLHFDMLFVRPFLVHTEAHHRDSVIRLAKKAGIDPQDFLLLEKTSDKDKIMNLIKRGDILDDEHCMKSAISQDDEISELDTLSSSYYDSYDESESKNDKHK